MESVRDAIVEFDQSRMSRLLSKDQYTFIIKDVFYFTNEIPSDTAWPLSINFYTEIGN